MIWLAYKIYVFIVTPQMEEESLYSITLNFKDKDTIDVDLVDEIFEDTKGIIKSCTWKRTDIIYKFDHEIGN